MDFSEFKLIFRHTSVQIGCVAILSKADKSEPDFKGRIFAFALLKYS